MRGLMGDPASCRSWGKSGLPHATSSVLRVGLLILLWLVAAQASAQTFAKLLSFSGTGGAYPGDAPLGSLTLSGTTLYGMTEDEGNSGYGSVFSVGTNGSGFQNLLSFSGTGGAYPGEFPNGSLTLSGTTLYGMTPGTGITPWGANAYNGNVFSVGTDGSGFQNLLTFTGPSGAYPGAYPVGRLTLIGTNLYGMTETGNNIFSIGTNGSGFQNLAFPGQWPGGSLMLSGTTFYGMTSYGGSSVQGNVFSVGADGSGLQNLISFSGTGGAFPGEYPQGSLTLGGTTLYGMTFQGGSSGIGNVFSVGADGSGFQNLLSFSGTGGAFPGEYPRGSLTLIGTTLYGMTAQGGSGGIGNIFSVGTNGSGFHNLLSFSGSGGAYPGGYPYGDLTAASSAAVALGGAVNATIISGGTATLAQP